ncbi:NADH-quinone oxidoreductase subunit NuoF family protein [soil metagenome]
MTMTDVPRIATDHDALPPVLSFGPPRILAGAAQDRRVDLAAHRTLHGALVPRSRGWLSSSLAHVRMKGRGGAAFPVSIKLDAMPKGRSASVLVNGSESEPASWKDRVLMRQCPHLVLDGALTIAAALTTKRITIAVHDVASARSLEQACRERSDASSVTISITGNAFVGGEIRAVINGLNGDRGLPGGRRVLPTVDGIDHGPTFASNVETFAQIGLLALTGATEYARVGSTNEPGTTLVTMVGDVPFPGVIEVPIGIPLSSLLQSPPGDRRAVLIGGYHGTWVDHIDHLVIERDALRIAGAPLNAGVIARISADHCALVEVSRVTSWLASESAGQCGPCFFGLPAVARGVQSMVEGAGSEPMTRLVRHLDTVSGRGACAHPDGSVQFVRSAMLTLDAELRQHAEHGSCGRIDGRALPVVAAA